MSTSGRFVAPRMVFLALALAGCGEGGGGGTIGAPAANHSPLFTSAASATVIENSTDPFYQASASDADGDAVSYSITGGADAAKFTVTASGQLRFSTAPNFDLPGDADGDNIYVVEVSASDGRSSTPLAVSIAVTNSKEGIHTRRVAIGFVHPVSAIPVPGDNKVIVAEKSGAIYLLDPATGTRSAYVTVPDVASDGEHGIMAVAVSPSFHANGLIYVLFNSTAGRMIVREYYRAAGVGPVGSADLDLGQHSTFGNDNGGWLMIGPDGNLYVATGDAGGDGDPTGSAQNPSSRFGKLLRVSPELDPFAGASPKPVTVSVIALGLHNPIGGDFFSGAVLLPDRGTNVREEVSMVSLASTDNLGWPFKEGSQTVRPGAPAGLIDPVLEYPHGTAPRAGSSIMGGTIYRGAIASLSGKYIFIDASGAIFDVAAGSLQQGQTLAATMFERRDLDFAPDVGTIGRPVAIAQDASGVIYIVDDDGDIFQVPAS